MRGCHLVDIIPGHSSNSEWLQLRAGGRRQTVVGRPLLAAAAFLLKTFPCRMAGHSSLRRIRSAEERALLGADPSALP